PEKCTCPVFGSSGIAGLSQLEKSNSPARSNGTPSDVSFEASAWSNEPAIGGRPQLYSMKFGIDARSLRFESTAFRLAHGEMSSSGWRGPKPQRPCWPASGVPEPHWPAPVSESATVCDGFVTPLYTWSYQPSESS